MELPSILTEIPVNPKRDQTKVAPRRRRVITSYRLHTDFIQTSCRTIKNNKEQYENIKNPRIPESFKSWER